MRWDEIAAQYDLVNIRPLIGGRVLIGYPPAVGTVDVNLTEADLLSDSHIIGRVVAGAFPGWTFALAPFSGREIVELPCGQRVVIDDWIIDTGAHRDIRQHAVPTLRGVIRAPDGARMFLHNAWAVACYDRSGHAWTSPGLFAADMVSVQLTGDQLSCRGYLDWVEPGRQFELLLSAHTGEVVGGDPEAFDLYRG